MRIVVFSDTHQCHNDVIVPDGDVLLFAGDACESGVQHELHHFLTWMDSLPHKHKIMIAGNHDTCLEHSQTFELIPESITYLQDAGVRIDGLHFYGSPWTPTFGQWAFMRNRGHNIDKYWQQIPKDTDVLITHGPAMRILDCVPTVIQGLEFERFVGCAGLLARLMEVKPQLHVFGHIHESQGVVEGENTLFINASFKGADYRNPAHYQQPRVVDWDGSKMILVKGDN